MSDESLRQLERRFKDTGSVADEIAWLLGLSRAGPLDWVRYLRLVELAPDAAGDQLQHHGLTLEQLNLAVHCRHQPARDLLLQQGVVPRASDLDYDWFRALQEWGLPAVVQAALALVRFALPEVESETIERVTAWVTTPREDLAREAFHASLEEARGATDKHRACLVGWLGAAASRQYGPSPLFYASCDLVRVVKLIEKSGSLAQIQAEVCSALLRNLPQLHHCAERAN